ncbi:MAG: hypothetical protein SGPRY_012178 [Prymnesium sp.]
MRGILVLPDGSGGLGQGSPANDPSCPPSAWRLRAADFCKKPPPQIWWLPPGADIRRGRRRGVPSARDCFCSTESLLPRHADPLGFGRRVPAGSLPGMQRARPSDYVCEKGNGFVTFQCSEQLLLPPTPTEATPLPSLGGVHVLMATYDHFGHGLMAIVQRVINQILLSSSLGFEPFVFIGERPFAEPQACEYGPSPYFDASLGSNVWDYWFLQPADYRMGMTSVRGQPVLSVQVASVAQADRTGPVRSYGSPASYNRPERHATRLAAHQMVGRGGVKLVQPAIRDEAASLFRVWRGRSGHVMGVHVRGTDKVVQPKVPPEAYFPFIEAYFSAHSDAILFVATDDDKYSARIWQRYQKVLSSGRLVRASNSSAHAAALGSVQAAYDKGRRVLLDALLLSQASYLTRAK